MRSYPSYSVAIRTLGTAGIVFNELVECLGRQTIRPDGIYVYIAEGYKIPERVAAEQYIPCRKGMVAQRALSYFEITSEYILFCDDDIFLPDNAVELLFDSLIEWKADGIAPNVYPNHSMSLKQKLKSAIFDGTFPSFRKEYAFRVRNNACFSYALRPQPVMLTQSFAGACSLVSKRAFLSIHYEEEVWLDKFRYALGDDQVLSFKLFVNHYKLLVHYQTGIEHRDSCTGHTDSRKEKYYSRAFLHYVIWYRSILQRQSSGWQRAMTRFSFSLYNIGQISLAILSCLAGRNLYKPVTYASAVFDARKFVQTEEFRTIPLWPRGRA